MKKIILFLLILVMFSLNASAYSLSGLVYDKNNNPIEYVSIGVEDPAIGRTFTGGLSDENGEFNLNVDENKEYLLHISRIDYKAIEEKAWSNTDKIYYLEVDPFILPPITVVSDDPRAVVKANVEFNQFYGNCEECIDYLYQEEGHRTILALNDKNKVHLNSRESFVRNINNFGRIFYIISEKTLEQQGIYIDNLLFVPTESYLDGLEEDEIDAETENYEFLENKLDNFLVTNDNNLNSYNIIKKTDSDMTFGELDYSFSGKKNDKFYIALKVIDDRKEISYSLIKVVLLNNFEGKEPEEVIPPSIPSSGVLSSGAKPYLTNTRIPSSEALSWKNEDFRKEKEQECLKGCDAAPWCEGDRSELLDDEGNSLHNNVKFWAFCADATREIPYGDECSGNGVIEYSCKENKCVEEKVKDCPPEKPCGSGSCGGEIDAEKPILSNFPSEISSRCMINLDDYANTKVDWYIEENEYFDVFIFKDDSGDNIATFSPKKINSDLTEKITFFAYNKYGQDFANIEVKSSDEFYNKYAATISSVTTAAIKDVDLKNNNLILKLYYFLNKLFGNENNKITGQPVKPIQMIGNTPGTPGGGDVSGVSCQLVTKGECKETANKDILKFDYCQDFSKIYYGRIFPDKCLIGDGKEYTFDRDPFKLENGKEYVIQPECVENTDSFSLCKFKQPIVCPHENPYCVYGICYNKCFEVVNDNGIMKCQECPEAGKNRAFRNYVVDNIDQIGYSGDSSWKNCINTCNKLCTFGSCDNSEGQCIKDKIKFYFPEIEIKEYKGNIHIGTSINLVYFKVVSNSGNDRFRFNYKIREEYNGNIIQEISEENLQCVLLWDLKNYLGIIEYDYFCRRAIEFTPKKVGSKIKIEATPYLENNVNNLDSEKFYKEYDVAVAQCSDNGFCDKISQGLYCSNLLYCCPTFTEWNSKEGQCKGAIESELLLKLEDYYSENELTGMVHPIIRETFKSLKEKHGMSEDEAINFLMDILDLIESRYLKRHIHIIYFNLDKLLEKNSKDQVLQLLEETNKKPYQKYLFENFGSFIDNGLDTKEKISTFFNNIANKLPDDFEDSAYGNNNQVIALLLDMKVGPSEIPDLLAYIVNKANYGIPEEMNDFVESYLFYYLGNILFDMKDKISKDEIIILIKEIADNFGYRSLIIYREYSSLIEKGMKHDEIMDLLIYIKTKSNQQGWDKRIVLLTYNSVGEGFSALKGSISNNQDIIKIMKDVLDNSGKGTYNIYSTIDEIIEYLNKKNIDINSKNILSYSKGYDILLTYLTENPVYDDYQEPISSVDTVRGGLKLIINNLNFNIENIKDENTLALEFTSALNRADYSQTFSVGSDSVRFGLLLSAMIDTMHMSAEGNKGIKDIRQDIINNLNFRAMYYMIAASNGYTINDGIINRYTINGGAMFTSTFGKMYEKFCKVSNWEKDQLCNNLNLFNEINSADPHTISLNDFLSMIASKGKLNNVMDVNKGLVVQRIVSILKMPKPEDNLLLLIDPIKKILSENNQNKVIIENSLIKNFKSASEDNKLKMGFLIKINCFDENGKFNGCSSFSEKNRNEAVEIAQTLPDFTLDKVPEAWFNDNKIVVKEYFVSGGEDLNHYSYSCEYFVNSGYDCEDEKDEKITQAKDCVKKLSNTNNYKCENKFEIPVEIYFMKYQDIEDDLSNPTADILIARGHTGGCRIFVKNSENDGKDKLLIFGGCNDETYVEHYQEVFQDAQFIADITTGKGEDTNAMLHYILRNVGKKEKNWNLIRNNFEENYELKKYGEKGGTGLKFPNYDKFLFNDFKLKCEETKCLASI